MGKNSRLILLIKYWNS